MRRLIAYINSLLLGVVLGMIFIAIVHALPHRHEHVRANGIMISYQVLGAKQQRTFLLFAGRVTRPPDWPPEFCGQSVERGYFLASPIVAISISPVRPVRFQQRCALRR